MHGPGEGLLCNGYCILVPPKLCGTEVESFLWERLIKTKNCCIMPFHESLRHLIPFTACSAHGWWGLEYPHLMDEQARMVPYVVL